MFNTSFEVNKYLKIQTLPLHISHYNYNLGLLPTTIKLQLFMLKNCYLSRSSKVTEFGGNREPVYDFLLVINSNLGPISHRY